MVDRNTAPYSKEFYREIEEEVKRVITKNYEDSSSDVELIRIHLKCMKEAVSQYSEEIERVLVRIESRNHKEVS